MRRRLLIDELESLLVPLHVDKDLIMFLHQTPRANALDGWVVRYVSFLFYLPIFLAILQLNADDDGLLRFEHGHLRYTSFLHLFVYDGVA